MERSPSYVSAVFLYYYVWGNLASLLLLILILSLSPQCRFPNQLFVTEMLLRRLLDICSFQGVVTSLIHKLIFIMGRLDAGCGWSNPGQPQPGNAELDGPHHIKATYHNLIIPRSWTAGP